MYSPHTFIAPTSATLDTIRDPDTDDSEREHSKYCPVVELHTYLCYLVSSSDTDSTDSDSDSASDPPSESELRSDSKSHAQPGLVEVDIIIISSPPRKAKSK